jgi:hypothetical protein
MVTFLDNGNVAGTTVADSASFFDKTLLSLSNGVHTISLYGSDTSGRTTLTLSFDVMVISGSTVTLSGFLLPPTLSVTKPVLKRPEAQQSTGAARDNSTVSAFFNNSTPIVKQVGTGATGQWTANVPEIFHLGTHDTSALVQDGNGGQSVLSQSLPFTVVLSADLNVDTRVNLTDFSILMFNYGRSTPPNLAADINDNGGAPDLVDFSIMMFHWTN